MDTKKISRDIPSGLEAIESGVEAVNYIRGFIEGLPKSEDEIKRLEDMHHKYPTDAFSDVLNSYVKSFGTLYLFDAKLETILQAFKRLSWFVGDVKTEIEEE